MSINFELLGWMTKKVKNCQMHDACPGDSGDIYCILCKDNVLSTKELKATNWSKIPAEV